MGEAILHLSLLLFGMTLMLTGEVIIWLLTLGRRTPRWDFYSTSGPFRLALFSEACLWLGAAFWLAITFGVRRLMA